MALTSSCLAPGEEEALTAPGLRFHRALAPFLQLVVGSAHPAVGRVLGYTTVFGFGFIVILCSFLFLFVFVVLRVPLLTLGPPGWSSAGGDARRDE